MLKSTVPERRLELKSLNLRCAPLNLMPSDYSDRIKPLVDRRIRMGGQQEPHSYRVRLGDDGVELHYEGPDEKHVYRCGWETGWLQDILRAELLD